jgi:hypothetical protein
MRNLLIISVVALTILLPLVTAGQYIKMSKARYGKTDDPVTVVWQGLDTNYWNWISIVPAGRPDDFRDLGRFHYLKGLESG